jgi:glyoxylase-like metal-dependent hydrolase (beta-lactamase superfamily II)
MTAVATVAPGVSRIVIGTPWPVGPVNVFVLDDDPFTLIDTGQRSEAARAELEAGFAAIGRSVEDLERIVVTHQHIDHCGLAGALVERSGAELCALDPLHVWLARFPVSLDEEDAFATTILRAHGVISARAERGNHRGGNGFGDPTTVTRRLRDGDVLEFAGRSLRVLARPGHSPYDTAFHDEASGTLFGGDHVLNWPSTPVLAPFVAAETRAGRPRLFKQYLASLRATHALEATSILAGHGEAVEDPTTTIAERLARYARIVDSTAAAVTPEPRTAAAIAAQIKGALPDRTAFFVLCEILGYLDELIDAGAVIEDVGDDGVSHFATVA